MSRAASVLVTAFACVVALVAALPSLGQASRSTRFNSRFYEVQTDIPQADAKPIAAHMDSVFAEYVKRFADFPARNSMPVRLNLFGTEKAYQAFLKGRKIEAANTAGVFFFDGDQAGLATFVEDQSELTMFHVLQHEGFHQFAFLRMGDSIPVWVNEGLAEYFGEAIIVKGRMQMGVAPENRIQAVALAIRSKTVFPFETLMNMSGEAWNEIVNKRGARAGLLYDQSWSMTHFLVHAEGGKYAKAFGIYVKRMSDGMNSRQAFTAAFGEAASYEQFETAWKKYVVEDMTPDAVSTAMERLEFLGWGAKVLAEQGIAVETMDDLQRELVARKAKLTITREGVRREFSAEDPSNFDPPPRDDAKKATSIEVVPPRKAGWPVGFRVKGLKVGLRLVWTETGRGSEGAWRSRVEFE